MNSSIALIQHSKLGMLVAVNIDVDGEACLPTAGGRFIGVVQSPMPEIGQAVPVNIERCLVVQSGGTFIASDYLAVDAAGKFVKAGALSTMSAAPTKTEVEAYTAALSARVAIALEASTASGEKVQIIRL